MFVHYCSEIYLEVIVFVTYVCRMETLKRKEVWLYKVVIDRLQKLADKKKWSLKQYMESILEKDSRKAIKKSTNESR